MSEQNIGRFEKKVKEGDIVITEGSMGSEFYIIKEGEFEIYKTGIDKKILNLAKVGPGDFFGEAALFESKKRTASVRAISPATLFVINKDTVKEIIKQSPDFALKMIDGLVNKIFNLNNKYSDALAKLYGI